MKLPTIRELMHEQAKFVRYQDGKLWYQIIWTRYVEGKIDPEWGGLFDFPIPIDDAGGGVFGTIEKAITLMRWIRKHLEYLHGAIGDARGEGVFDQ